MIVCPLPNYCKYHGGYIDMYGEHDLGCVHPKRRTLYKNIFARIFDMLFHTIFFWFEYRSCVAKEGYRKYCPFFEDTSPFKDPPPSTKEPLHNLAEQARKEEKCQSAITMLNPPKKSGLWRKEDHKKKKEE